MNLYQMMQRLKLNPMNMRSRRCNIPPNVNMQDPDAIIEHLMNTGQVNQSMYNNANQQLKQLKKQNNMM